MRTKLLGTILLLTFAASCEHKNKNSDPNAPSGGGPVANTPPANTPPANTPPANTPPANTPPANTPPVNAPPVNAPPAGGDDVRPPVAADLAEYTKDLKGTGKMVATFDTTMGAIHCELFPEKAPMTVANFVGLATGSIEWTNPSTGKKSNEPLYNGVIFHRIIDNFMIQGGDPLGQGTGGPGYEFDDEIHPELTFADPYVLAMANAGKRGGKGTNGSQFFVTTVATPWLQGKHTIFGELADDESREIVKKIEAVKKDGRDRPIEDVVIENVTVVEV